MLDNFSYIDNGCSCTPCSTENENTGCLYPSFTDCVTYNGTELSHLGLPVSPETTCSLTSIVLKIDDIIGQLSTGSAADWTTYDVNCLAPITTQKEFVEKISSQFCILKSGYNTFTTVTYVTDKTNLQNQINDLKNPSLTSAGCLAVVNTDTQSQIDTKLITQVENICSSLDISSITWNSCIATSSTPSTVKDGFTEVLSQICAVKTLISNSSQDTYKVLTSSADTTPDYITNKITTSPCLTSEITATNQLKLGLSFIPSIYTFDSNVFDTTVGLQGDCGQNILISLKNTPGVGTVTSVGVTSNDLIVTGTPISTSGTIDIELKDIVTNPGNFNNVIVNSKGLVTYGTLESYITSESDPTVPAWVKAITQTDINNWNNNVAITLPVASQTVLGGIKVGNGLGMSGDVLNSLYSQGYGIEIDPSYIISLSSSAQTSLNKANTALQNITGYITAGSNIVITGSGTNSSPYSIASTASGGGGIGYADLSAASPLTYNNTTGQFGITNATTSQSGYLSFSDFTTFNNKQDLLISGTNIKTVNGVSLLGSGNITTLTSVAWGSIIGTLSDQTDLQSALDNKQNLVTGGATTIVSSNLSADKALVSDGSGKVAVSATTSIELGYVNGVTSSIQSQINNKQDTLVSGSNIKTINGTSLLGSGDMVISTGGQVNSVVAGSNISVNNTDPINPIVSATTGIDIDSNLYNYGKTVTSFDGFDTQGGFTSFPIIYLNVPSTTVTIPPHAHRLVIQGGNETIISLPDPSLFKGREIYFKIQNVSDTTAFSTFPPYNGSTALGALLATSTDWVLLKIKAGNSSITSTYVWEVIELSKLDSSLYS